jgi:hypothetical protein
MPGTKKNTGQKAEMPSDDAGSDSGSKKPAPMQINMNEKILIAAIFQKMKDDDVRMLKLPCLNED